MPAVADRRYETDPNADGHEPVPAVTRPSGVDLSLDSTNDGSIVAGEMKP